MDTVYFKDKNGKIFQLCCNIVSATADFTSKEDVVTIPAVIDAGRCADSIAIETEKGTLVVNFNVNGRAGACNQCGVCCSHLIENCFGENGQCGMVEDGDYHRCVYLQILSGIGIPGGTQCAIHNSLLFEGRKSCLNWPIEPFEIKPYLETCGFSFGE